MTGRQFKDVPNCTSRPPPRYTKDRLHFFAVVSFPLIRNGDQHLYQCLQLNEPAVLKPTSAYRRVVRAAFVSRPDPVWGLG